MPTASEREVVSLAVGGLELRGWLSYDVDSDVLVEADGFELTTRPPDPAVAQVAGVREALQPGASVELRIDGVAQLAGILDDAAWGYDRRGGPTLRLSGRDRAAFLVDTAAPTMSLAGLTIRELAERLIERSGITAVTFDNAENRRPLRRRDAVPRLPDRPGHGADRRRTGAPRARGRQRERP